MTTIQKKYISKSQAEKFWIEKSRESVFHFIWYITGKKPAKHHRIWLANIFDPNTNRINMVAARESAKTTITVYALTWVMSKNPLMTNAIISVASKQAEDRLRMIRSTIEENARYRNVFPHIHIDMQQPNTKNEFTLKSTEGGMKYSVWRSLVERHGSTKDATLFVAGAGGKNVIGRRFSGFLLLDDIVDETYLSDTMQSKMIQYISQTLIPCVKEEGKVINIGTRWMIGDIYERLEKNPSWKTITIPAILYDEQGEKHSYWEDYWSLERLEEKRIEMDDDVLFKIMYLCDPTATTAGMFNHGQFREKTTTQQGEDLVFKEFYVTTDFAITAKTRSDWTVFILIGIDQEGDVHLLDGYRMKSEDPMGIAQSLDRFVDSCQSRFGRVNGVLTEKVAFQAALHQIIASQSPHLPLISVAPKGDKQIRSTPVEQYMRKNKLYIRDDFPFRSTLISEWVNFPNHRHDDTLDCVSLFFQHTGLNYMTAKLTLIKSDVFRF